jgi:hypothetical protein
MSKVHDPNGVIQQFLLAPNYFECLMFASLARITRLTPVGLSAAKNVFSAGKQREILVLVVTSPFKYIHYVSKWPRCQVGGGGPFLLWLEELVWWERVCFSNHLQ